MRDQVGLLARPERPHAESLAVKPDGRQDGRHLLSVRVKAALVEAGLDLAVNRNATIGVSYVGQLAGDVQDHAVKGKAVWQF